MLTFISAESAGATIAPERVNETRARMTFLSE